MGESVLRSRLTDAEISSELASAGVSAEESGKSVDPRAAQVLSEFHYDTLPGHRAHRATAHELRSADMVLAMTVGHARSLRAMMNDAGTPLTKLHLWREFDGSSEPAPEGVFGDGGVLAPGGKLHTAGRSRSDFYWSDGELDVPDPWFGGQDCFYTTLETVERGADGILEWIRA